MDILETLNNEIQKLQGGLERATEEANIHQEAFTRLQAERNELQTSLNVLKDAHKHFIRARNNNSPVTEVPKVKKGK